MPGNLIFSSLRGVVWLKFSCFTEGVTGAEEKYHQVLGYRWGRLCAIVVHEGEVTTPVVDGRVEPESHDARIVPDLHGPLC